jgi:hypothetical protein
MALMAGGHTRTWQPNRSFERSSSAMGLLNGSGGLLHRWEVATREREKRQGRRRSLRCRVQMVGEQEGNGQEALEAECINIGDGGLFAILPGSVAVGIGQRYTFRLHIRERGPEPGCGQCVSQQGEIIRLELLVDQTGYTDRIGIGVRLFGPRCGIVPMPAIR